MKKFITISTLFAGAALTGFAATPFAPDSPITAIVACSQEGGEAAALKIMEIQKKENLDVSKDTFVVSLLAACENADACLIKAAKDGNVFAIKAIKTKRLADAEATLLEMAKAGNADAIDALSTCGSNKSLDFFIENMANADKNIVDYVKVATELYKGLDKANKNAYKTKIQTLASSADGKVKTALERIITESNAKTTYKETTGAKEKKAKKKKSQ